MLVTAFASAVEGVNAYTITVEVNAAPGMPNFFRTGAAATCPIFAGLKAHPPKRHLL